MNESCVSFKAAGSNEVNHQRRHRPSSSSSERQLGLFGVTHRVLPLHPIDVGARLEASRCGHFRRCRFLGRMGGSCGSILLRWESHGSERASFFKMDLDGILEPGGLALDPAMVLDLRVEAVAPRGPRCSESSGAFSIGFHLANLGSPKTWRYC